MSGAIYLIQDNGQLVEMSEHFYESEDLLQKLLADYPKVLAGDQMDIGSPKRWLLISREEGIPAEEGGADRWAVDHLFLDQEAIPTLVEVKRSTDTRIRREVVGQMLDYAANAVVFWPIQTMRAHFEANCEIQGIDPNQKLAEFLDSDIGQEEFWEKAKTNLQAGKIRIIFVSDAIPTELRRIVEFLNKQMDPAEVLAVEVKQFTGQGLKTLVPTLIGQKKTGLGPVGKVWDESSFLKELESNGGIEERKIAERILEWAKKNDRHIWWGRGSKIGSFFPMIDYKGGSYWSFSVWTNGAIEVQFGMMSKKPPFDEESKRLELRRRLNEIPGVSIPENGIDRRPSIRLSVLTNEDILNQFLSVFDWVIGQVKEE